MDKPLTIGSSGTWLPNFFAPAESRGIDVMTRLFTKDGTVNLVSTSTAKFLQAYIDAGEVIHVLSRAVGGLKRREEYSGQYVAFLQGQIDEQEFEQASAQQAYEPQAIDPQELAKYTRILIRYTTADFTPSEVGELFEADKQSVDAAVQLMLDLRDHTVDRA